MCSFARRILPLHLVLHRSRPRFELLLPSFCLTLRKSVGCILCPRSSPCPLSNLGAIRPAGLLRGRRTSLSTCVEHQTTFFAQQSKDSQASVIANVVEGVHEVERLRTGKIAQLHERQSGRNEL